MLALDHFLVTPCSRPGSKLLGALISTTLMILMLPTVGAADYGESFGKGLQAMETKDWPAAAEWFEKAIAENPNAGGKVSVPGGRELYVPYYYLGLAHYHADEPRKASEAWRQSAIQGVLAKKKKKLQQQVDEYLFEINNRLTQESEAAAGTAAANTAEVTAPVVTMSPEEIEVRRRALGRQIDRAARKLAKLTDPRFAEALNADPSLVEARNMGESRLIQARVIYDEGKTDPILLEEAHAHAVSAADILEKAVLNALRLEKEATASEPASSAGG